MKIYFCRDCGKKINEEDFNKLDYTLPPSKIDILFHRACGTCAKRTSSQFYTHVFDTKQFDNEDWPKGIELIRQNGIPTIKSSYIAWSFIPLALISSAFAIGLSYVCIMLMKMDNIASGLEAFFIATPVFLIWAFFTVRQCLYSLFCSGFIRVHPRQIDVKYGFGKYVTFPRDGSVTVKIAPMTALINHQSYAHVTLSSPSQKSVFATKYLPDEQAVFLAAYLDAICSAPADQPLASMPDTTNKPSTLLGTKRGET